MQELEEAYYYIIRSALEQFPEYSLLRAGKALSGTSQLSALSPFLDESDIIGVAGRLQNANFLSFDTKIMGYQATSSSARSMKQIIMLLALTTL